jgi:hypothetical protein
LPEPMQRGQLMVVCFMVKSLAELEAEAIATVERRDLASIFFPNMALGFFGIADCSSALLQLFPLLSQVSRIHPSEPTRFPANRSMRAGRLARALAGARSPREPFQTSPSPDRAGLNYQSVPPRSSVLVSCRSSVLAFKRIG